MHILLLTQISFVVVFSLCSFHFPIRFLDTGVHLSNQLSSLRPFLKSSLTFHHTLELSVTLSAWCRITIYFEFSLKVTLTSSLYQCLTDLLKLIFLDRYVHIITICSARATIVEHSVCFVLSLFAVPKIATAAAVQFVAKPPDNICKNNRIPHTNNILRNHSILYSNSINHNNNTYIQ